MRAFFPSTFHSIKTYCYLITLLFTLSCQPSAVNFPAKHYRAVSKRDTAYLQLTKNENHFYGHYTIQYGNSGKDSGEIRGNIKGDTLIGDYFYMPHSGGVKKKNTICTTAGWKNTTIRKWSDSKISGYSKLLA